jgi:hemerythrin-like metal-binding protein
MLRITPVIGSFPDLHQSGVVRRRYPSSDMNSEISSMPTLQWSDALVLGLPAMDETHQEFVALLGTVEAAGDDTVLAAWRDLVAHTDDHFGREDQWMLATRFSSNNCHSSQHQAVLQVMREGQVRGQAGDLALLRQMARELGVWFAFHAQSMDAALALHLRQIGYDPVSGVVNMPGALPQEQIHGCGGAGCSGIDSAQHPESAALAG